MLVPKVFALSAMSVMARSAYAAAATVSLPKDEIRLAEKLVTVSMYSLADSPAVR